MPNAPAALRGWFLKHKRALPWRKGPFPYAVWVSEVMLQQTQAAVVIPYFHRWMAQFPTVASLAESAIDDVLKLWEGLGYYSRARHLHRGAQVIVQRFGGELPSDRAALRTIPGIGEYTANAICAFAFGQKTAAVDGNVLRVACRYFGIEEDIAKPKTRTLVQERVDGWLPDERPAEVAEALIELGATICGRNPKCSLCPLEESCLAKATDRQHTLPIKKVKTQYELLHRVVAVVIGSQDRVLLRRGKVGQVMADLYEFPYFASQGPWLANDVIHTLGIKAKAMCALEDVRHTFTRFRVRLYPWVLECECPENVEGMQWMPLSSLEKLPFSSGHRRIVKQLLDNQIVNFF